MAWARVISSVVAVGHVGSAACNEAVLWDIVYKSVLAQRQLDVYLLPPDPIQYVLPLARRKLLSLIYVHLIQRWVWFDCALALIFPLYNVCAWFMFIVGGWFAMF